MPPEGGEAEDPQIGVDLRAVIHHFQRRAVQRRLLIDPQPLVVHIGEQAAEAAADQPIQRHLFQKGQSPVAVAEDPVHRPALVIEYHFDVREGKGQIIEALKMGVIGFLRGDISLAEAADDQLLLCLKPGGDLIPVPDRIGQRLAVGQLNDIGDVVDGHDRHQTAAAHLEEAVAQSLLQLVERHPCCVAPASECVDLGIVLFHQDIKDGVDIEHDVPVVRTDGDVIRFRHSGHLFSDRSITRVYHELWHIFC